MTDALLSGNKCICGKRTNYAARRREKRHREAMERLIELCKPEISKYKAVSAREFVQE